MDNTKCDIEFLAREMRRLHTLWDCLEELYFAPGRTVLREHAGHLLAELDRALATEILLTISRLCDPIETKGKSNLVFDRFVSEHPSLAPKINDAIDSLKQLYSEKIKPIRDWRLGHNDLDLSRGQRKLGWPELGSLRKAKEICTEIVQDIYGELGHAAIGFSRSFVRGEVSWIEAVLRYVSPNGKVIEKQLKTVIAERDSVEKQDQLENHLDRGV